MEKIIKKFYKRIIFTIFLFITHNFSYATYTVKQAEDLTIQNQAIIPQSGPTAVIGFNLAADAGEKVNNIYIRILADQNVEPQDFRKIAIYKDVNYKGYFDTADFEIASVENPETLDFYIDIPGGFSVYNTDSADKGTQGSDLWVVIFTSKSMKGDWAKHDKTLRAKFRIYVAVPGVVGITTKQITCEARVVDLIPWRSDMFKNPKGVYVPQFLDTNLLFLEGFTIIYAYGQYPLLRAINTQDHLPGAAPCPEVAPLCSPYRVLGIDIAGRSTYYENDNEYLKRITIIMEDTGKRDWTPAWLASILPPFPPIGIYKDTDNDGNFNPMYDTPLAPDESPSYPHAIGGTPIAFDENGQPYRWKFTWTFENNKVPLEKTADEKVDFFIMFSTKPEHGYVTARPYYGADFKIYIDPEIEVSSSNGEENGNGEPVPLSEGVSVWRPVGESPPDDMVFSPTLIRKINEVKDVIMCFYLWALPDGPVEPDGVPIAVFMLNMCDNWAGSFGDADALHWIRVWFKAEYGFKPNQLMPLSDDENSGVSLWLDGKVKQWCHGCPDERLVDLNALTRGEMKLSNTDIFVPISSSSLVWYNSDGTIWSPENDDPLNPEGHKRYFVILAPKNPIPFYSNDFIEKPLMNDYNDITNWYGRECPKDFYGYDLYIAVKARGISVPETAYLSDNPFERGADSFFSAPMAIGLTKYNDEYVHIDTTYPWEDIQFTTNNRAMVFDYVGKNEQGIDVYKPIQCTVGNGAVPTFFTNLTTYPEQPINKFEKTAVVGINVVAPPGRIFSIGRVHEEAGGFLIPDMTFIILDENKPPTLNFAALVKPFSDPNHPDGGCGIALYKDTNRNGRFDPLDKRVWMTRLPWLLPSACDDPEGRLRVAMKFGNPPPEYSDTHTDPGVLPTDDVGENAGPEYFLVIQPTEYMNPGDRFRILFWGSGLVQEYNITFKEYWYNPVSGEWEWVDRNITQKKVLTHSLVCTNVNQTLLTKLTSKNQTIDATSDPVGVIGINAIDPLGKDEFREIRVYFNPKEGIFPDNTPFPTVIAPLTTNITSGVSLWQDKDSNGIFNWRVDTLIPVQWSEWKSDYEDGFVDGDGTLTQSEGYKTPIFNWQGKVLNYFNNTDNIIWYDANGDSIWTPGEDTLWIDEVPDGVYTSNDKIIVGPTPPQGTFGFKLHGSTLGFVYYDEDGDGSYDDGEDIYFVGRGRNSLGWYVDGTLWSGVKLPDKGNLPYFFVAIRTSEYLLYKDVFSVSLPSNGIRFMYGYSYGNVNLTTDELTANVNLMLTDLIPTNNYVVSPGSEIPIIGMNFMDKLRDGNDGGRYLNKITIYVTGNLADLKPLDKNGAVSGIAVYKESGHMMGWDSLDTPINLYSIGISGNKVIMTFPTKTYSIPDTEGGADAGDDYYIIIRTNENAKENNLLRFEIKNDLSSPSGYAVDRVTFDVGNSGEYIVNTNYIKIGTPITLKAPQIISAVSEYVNGKWRVRLIWKDNSENPEEDGFEIQRRTISGTWATIGEVGRDVTTFIDDNNGVGLPFDTIFYYRVGAFLNTNPRTYAWSAPISITIGAGMFVGPSNLTATPEVVNEKWQVVLNWKDNSENPEEDGFRVERKTGTENWGEIGGVGRDVTTFIDDNEGAGLVENTTYTYRVRGFRDTPGGGKEYSPYSNEVSVTLTRPQKPYNISPENNALNVPITPTLIASDYIHPYGVSFAGSQWQIRKEGFTYAQSVYDSRETTPATSHRVPANRLNFGTKYYWHVRYKDANGGWSEWSDETCFTTRSNNPPNTPTNIEPESGSTGISKTPTLKASPFEDPDGDNFGFAQWKIREDGSSQFTQLQNSATSIVVPSGILKYNKTYWWSVRYSDQFGSWSNWSTETSFTTMEAPQGPPEKPYNVLPYGGQRNVELKPLLKGSVYIDEDEDPMKNSHWQIRTESDSYSNPIWENYAGPVTAIQVDKELKPNTKYYWRVRYQDSDDMWSDWSDETWFLTTTSGEIPTPSPSPPEEGGGGCFIASVCFGEDSWQVRVLREFRDRVLVRNEAGKKFVKFYYRNSPYIADYIRQHRILVISVKVLIYPFVILCFLVLSGIFPYLIFCSSLIYLIRKFKMSKEY